MPNVILFYLLFFTATHDICESPDWGFFGHRKINRYAVFTLPQPMLPLFKGNIAYLEEHSVDPDKRRYATKFEAIRHYIDIDHWGEYPFDNVPRKWGPAVLMQSPLELIKGSDTIRVLPVKDNQKYLYIIEGDTVLTATDIQMDIFFKKDVLPKIYENDFCEMDATIIDVFFNTTYFSRKYDRVKIVDVFSDFGILPYHLVKMQRDLTLAFKNEDVAKVLRLSAEFGHYIGDAHVPLHTTENYNGQMSDQVGIHAFWESRIPELFAEKEYDFFAGKASYISDPEDYYWNIVLASHSYLDEVLGIEKRLRETFPSDRQFCYEERLSNTVRIECEEFAKAYQSEMQGMVEDRMIASIKAIGDAWYTAWIDAGQPVLQKQTINEAIVEEIKPDPNIKTRAHDND